MSRCLIAVVLLGIVSTAYPDPGQKVMMGADAPAGSGLRSQLLGTWRLVSYEARQENGTVSYPMGKDLQGFIMYTHDGHMSAQLMKTARSPVSSTDVNKIAPPELAAAAAGYFSYAGTFVVDDAARTVTHHVRVALLPNWVGTEQKRNVKFDGNRLELSAGPLTIDGRQQTAHILWERVQVQDTK